MKLKSADFINETGNTCDRFIREGKEIRIFLLFTFYIMTFTVKVQSLLLDSC